MSMSNDPSRNGGRIALCASCDRCRARKTKCDGNRPCSNCANKYMKKHRLTSIAGIDSSLFECVYSPAKRRGPVPGKASQNRKTEEMDRNLSGLKGNKSNLMRMDMGMGGYGNVNVNSAGNDGLFGHQQAQLAALMGVNGNQSGLGVGLDRGMGMNQGGAGMNDPLALRQQLLMQQQQMRMQQSLGMDSSGMGLGVSASGGFDNGIGQQQQNLMLQQQLQMMQQMQGQGFGGGPENAGIGGIVPVSAPASTSSANMDVSAPAAQRLRIDEAPPDNIGVEKSVTKHLSKLEKSSVFGNRLRSYYSLAIDTLFNLPPVPSDEEYCAKLNANMTPAMLPPFDVAALRAARFAEIALGALINNQIVLALELSNATVVCLKQCVKEPVHPSCMFDVAKAYFLLGMFRSYRGDMQRYFKYRRVCLAKLSQLGKKVVGIQQLLSAISFHDSWAYMIYNANSSDLPNIDDVIPALPECGKTSLVSSAEQKYQISTDHTKISSDPLNQMWIQGPPPVFINNEAPPLSRALDALACSVRSCCDHANEQFEGMECSNHGGTKPSPTNLAVTSNTNELCSRNMVLSAYTLVQQSEATNKTGKNIGHHLLISAMDGFLEGGDGESSGFTDTQIQSFLSACNTAIDHPHLLYQGGPTYHMITNSAIMLCHVMNGLYADKDSSPMIPDSDMEAALFNEVLDTYIAVRKLLNAHRRKVPVLLRCHGLPRPNLLHSRDNTADVPFIDLGDTQMCSSRSCQGFVLMACSPCVAAERAQAMENKNSTEMHDLGIGFDASLNGLGDDIGLDDDDLLRVLGRIVAA